MKKFRETVAGWSYLPAGWGWKRPSWLRKPEYASYRAWQGFIVACATWCFVFAGVDIVQGFWYLAPLMLVTGWYELYMAKGVDKQIAKAREYEERRLEVAAAAERDRVAWERKVIEQLEAMLPPDDEYRKRFL
jgi:hypothetical protein